MIELEQAASLKVISNLNMTKVDIWVLFDSMMQTGYVTGGVVFGHKVCNSTVVGLRQFVCVYVQRMNCYLVHKDTAINLEKLLNVKLLTLYH